MLLIDSLVDDFLFLSLLFHIEISMVQAIRYMMKIVGILIVISKSDLILHWSFLFQGGICVCWGVVCFGLYVFYHI